MAQNSYDLIIVGTGTAGTILAACIAQYGVQPGSGEPLSIASIEAGPYWKGAQRPGYGIPLRRQRMTNLQAGTRFPMARTNCIYCGYCGSAYMCKYDSKSSSRKLSAHRREARCPDYCRHGSFEDTD